MNVMAEMLPDQMVFTRHVAYYGIVYMMRIRRRTQSWRTPSSPQSGPHNDTNDTSNSNDNSDNNNDNNNLKGK